MVLGEVVSVRYGLDSDSMVYCTQVGYEGLEKKRSSTDFVMHESDAFGQTSIGRRRQVYVALMIKELSCEANYNVSDCQ